MKRTLLAVGVAVLASMMWIPEYVPYVGRYRLPIFALNQYEIDWGQMILQTIFAAVAAAVISNSRCQWLRERGPGTMHSSSPRNRFARATRSHRSAFAKNYKPLHMSVILSEAKNLWSSLELISSRQLEMSRFCST
jgi:hypothetical protein